MKLPDSFTVTLTDADYQRAIKALKRPDTLRSECCPMSQAVKRVLGVRKAKTSVKRVRVVGAEYHAGPLLMAILDWFDTVTPRSQRKTDWPKTLPKRWQKTLTFRKEVA